MGPIVATFYLTNFLATDRYATAEGGKDFAYMPVATFVANKL